MRSTLLLSALVLCLYAPAQQITNVTFQPSPLRACLPVSFVISGTSGGGFTFDFVESQFGEDFISLVYIVTVGPGSSPYTVTMGPYEAMAAGDYAVTISLKRNGNITSTWTGTMTVQEALLPDMGEPNDITICPNDPPFQMLSQLGGTPASGGVWLDPMFNQVPNGIFKPGINMDGSYMYFIDLPAPCDAQYQFLDVTTLPNNFAGLDSTISLCTLPGGNPVDLSTFIGGTPDAGGTWSGPGGNTSIFTPGVSPTGGYVYQVTGIPPCSDPTATITVLAAPENNAGVGGPAVFCFDETSAILSTYVSGGQSSGFWYAPSGFAIAYFNDPVNVSVYGAGNYAYVVAESDCPADTSYVPVTLDGPPCTLGLGDLAADNARFELLPNPATGQVILDATLGHAWSDLSAVILDLEGRVVLRQSLPGAQVVHQAIDISALAPGAYLVQMIGGPNLPAQRLLVQ